MANTSETPVGLMDRRELAAALNVHPITISKWQDEGLPVAHRGGKGRASRYNLTDVQAWRAARDAEAAKGDGPLDPVQERAKKERWQALLAEQTFKARERELLPKAEVEKAWSAEVAAVRAILLALPTALSDRVHRASTRDGVVGVERELHVGIRDALRELAAPPAADTPTSKSPRRKKAKKRKARAKTEARA